MRVSEVFYSLQGEGERTGHPSVFVRFFGCNFRCPGFGMPEGQLSTEPDDIAKNIDWFESYADLPLAKTGCDSYPSWHPKFARFSPDLTEEELYSRIMAAVPEEVLNKGIDLVFTGGEPLLPKTQKFIRSLFNKFNFGRFKLVTFETNGTQIPDDELIKDIEAQVPVLFSVSPKLKCSGVPRDKAIVPAVIKRLESRRSYLKFVVSGEDDLSEVEDIITKLSFKKDVYIMPEGGTPERYNNNIAKVAEYSLRRGFILSPRLHITVFGNSWGT